MRAIDVAVVGGGLGSLATTYNTLTFPRASREVAPVIEIFEARFDVGGLIRTTSSPGLGRIDHGAEHIDSWHKSMRELCRRLKMELFKQYSDDRQEPYVEYHVAGVCYSEQEFGEAVMPIVQAIRADLRVLHREDSDPQKIEFAHRLSGLSVEDYVRGIEVGKSEWIRCVVLGIHRTEYGQDPAKLSALEFLDSGYEKISRRNPGIYELGYAKFIVEGGTHKIIEALARHKSLKDRIRVNTLVEAIKQRSSGDYEITFGGSSEPIIAAQVVLGAPLPALRNITLDVHLLPEQRRAIEEAQYAHSAKLFLGLRNCPLHLLRPEVQEVYSEALGGTAWVPSRDQKDQATVSIAVLLGGTHAEQSRIPSMGQLIPLLDEMYPGISGYPSGEFHVDLYDSRNPLQGGAWIALAPGQELFLEALKKQSEGVHFVGAHVDIDYPGYMEGAARSAENVSRRL